MFGNSPDETAYSRLAINKECVGEALTAIQPFLCSYKFGDAPQAVLLDVSSIVPDAILLLDSYFYVVVFHGSNIAAWRKADYQLQPEHTAFAALLEVRACVALLLLALNALRLCMVKLDHGQLCWLGVLHSGMASSLSNAVCMRSAHRYVQVCRGETMHGRNLGLLHHEHLHKAALHCFGGSGMQYTAMTVLIQPGYQNANIKIDGAFPPFYRSFCPFFCGLDDGKGEFQFDQSPIIMLNLY